MIKNVADDPKAYNDNKVIQVIAPGATLRNPNDLPYSLQRMQELGYISNVAPDMLRPILFCANTDEYRFEHLTKAINDPSIDVIWPVRGGYGATRIIEGLFTQDKTLQTKHFIGFSDITALHLFLYQQWGWHPIHGLVYQQIGNSIDGITVDKRNFEMVQKIIHNTLDTITMGDLQPLNNVACNTKTLTGTITGGNLSIIQTSIGTKWEIQSDGHMLILEDLGEAAYRIDRMLEHLRQAGKFNQIKCLLFGEYLNCPGNLEEATLTEALIRVAEVLNALNVPVFQTNLIGHGYSNIPFVYGASAKITPTEGTFSMVQTIPQALRKI